MLFDDVEFAPMYDTMGVPCYDAIQTHFNTALAKVKASPHIVYYQYGNVEILSFETENKAAAELASDYVNAHVNWHGMLTAQTRTPGKFTEIFLTTE